MSEITYTQKIDSSTGAISYVPIGQPPESGKQTPPEPSKPEPSRSAVETVGSPDFELDTRLGEVLSNLVNNNKRLRYQRRLEDGKLDGGRLHDYKTSSKLFKRRAIKYRNYQFTFLIDTSGSMRCSERDSGITNLEIASSAVVKTIKALDEINIKTSVVAMNCAIQMVKALDEEFNPETFISRITDNYDGDFTDDDGGHFDNCSGTSETVAYNEVMAYLDANTPAKTQNVVIVVSDGEPGGRGTTTNVIMADRQLRVVPRDRNGDYVEELSRFWKRRTDVKAFGLGIRSNAHQIPTNKRVDTVADLPKVMANLLKEIIA